MNVAMQTNPMQADQVSWRCEQFIGGNYTRGEGALLAVENPATGKAIVAVPISWSTAARVHSSWFRPVWATH
jgi:hypothetical protein